MTDMFTLRGKPGRLASALRRIRDVEKSHGIGSTHLPPDRPRARGHGIAIPLLVGRSRWEHPSRRYTALHYTSARLWTPVLAPSGVHCATPKHRTLLPF